MPFTGSTSIEPKLNREKENMIQTQRNQKEEIKTAALPLFHAMKVRPAFAQLTLLSSQHHCTAKQSSNNFRKKGKQILKIDLINDTRHLKSL